MNCKNYLLLFIFMFTLNCNVNGQEVSTEESSAPKTVLADTIDDAGDVDEPDADETVGDADEESNAEETKEHENTPVTIQVNAEGQLVGQTMALVNDQWLPVEATIALISDNVLLDKVVADEDGSFSFSDVVPGSYKVCGTAASYCGNRAVTVLSECGCGDRVDLSLRQDPAGACYAELPSAPAATFSQGPSFGGGFAGGGSGTGGGFAGGGGFVASGGSGVASGLSGLRVLAVGGIVTAIAVSDNDDVATPSE